jgi:hypothetical protein
MNFTDARYDKPVVMCSSNAEQSVNEFDTRDALGASSEYGNRVSPLS